MSSSNSPAEPGAVDVDRALMAALARDGRASFTELAEHVGLSVSAVHQRVRRLEQRGLITGYRATLDATQIGLPLTAFVSITPTDAVSDSLLKNHLHEALNELPERERQIVELRFGMKDDRPRTLEEVGREFDITRERVRQIQMKTLNLLREQRRTQNLREYLK